MTDKSLINNFLFECQCALFLVDITNTDSFNLIKELIKNINMNNFPNLKTIFVQNKLDLESTRQVSSFELKEYCEANKLDFQEISVKTGENIQELINKINQAVNESKHNLASNVVTELDKKVNFMNGQGALSFILIGDSTVGKTCFFNRYFKNQFTETFLSTIGIDKEVKNVKIGNDCYKLTGWDTAGQERFRCLPKKYYQNADSVLLLFDVTNEESFASVSNWMNDVKENSNRTITSDGNKESDIALYFIGNKIDNHETPYSFLGYACHAHRLWHRQYPSTPAQGRKIHLPLEDHIQPHGMGTAIPARPSHQSYLSAPLRRGAQRGRH